MILNEDFFDNIKTEDIVNTESDDIEKTYQHSVSLTYKFDSSELVDENYKQGSVLVNQFNKIYRRINTLFNNAPFFFDYKINICAYPINKCNSVRKFGPYDIHYNDSKSDARMSINIMFDSVYTTLSNIANFFLQLFRSRISDTNFITHLITIKESKHFNYRDYSFWSYSFIQKTGNNLELADFVYINSNIKFLSEEFCKPGSYSKYTLKRGINNGRYLFNNTLIIDDIEYVVFIYDCCLKTDDKYNKANFIKLIEPYKGSDKMLLIITVLISI